MIKGVHARVTSKPEGAALDKGGYAVIGLALEIAI
jgi:hypothetical protein